MTTKSGQNPMRAAVWMSKLALAHACPRCGARTRSGSVCKGQAMANGRCRMHGGASTGPRTAEGLQRIKQAPTIHGDCSAEARALRRMLRGLSEEQRRLLRLVK